jgi:hypothetical protein
MKSKRPSLEGTVKRAAEAPATGREGKRRMTVHLDPEMHRELRHLAVDLGTSAEAVIVAALTAELQKHRSSK